MTTYAIGDIHGCWATLERLLHKIAWNPEVDRLWLVGDLVNRGPSSLEVLRWAYHNRSRVTAVLGNHDLHLLARAAGVKKKADDSLGAVLGASDLTELLSWLRGRPLLHAEGDTMLVHAGLHPTWDLEEAAGLSEAIAQRMATDEGLEVLYRLRKTRWTPDLEGDERLAAALAVMTNVRIVAPDGRPKLSFTGPAAQAPEGCRPWFEDARVLRLQRRIIFGHWAMLGLSRHGDAICLDSGCHWGGSLTAIDLESGELISEPVAAEDSSVTPATAFAAFDDGVPIPPAARSLFFASGTERTQDLGEFRSWLNRPIDPERAADLTPLLAHLAELRPELRLLFPDPRGRDLERFAVWIDENAQDWLDVHPSFVDPVRPIADRYREVEKRQRRRKERREALTKPFKSLVKTLIGPYLTGWIKALRSRSPGKQGVTASVGQKPSTKSVGRFEPGFNVVGYFTAETGMGEAVRLLADSIERVDLPLTRNCSELHVLARTEERSAGSFKDHHPYSTNLMVVNADQVGPMASSLTPARLDGRQNIGFWLWELETFPDRWPEAFSILDEVWTPSRFCQDAIASVSPLPVHCVPLPVEIGDEPVPNRKRFKLPEDCFIFLFAFDYLSVVERKNPLGLVRAFSSAFRGDDRVMLVIKSANQEQSRTAAAELRREAEGAPVRFMDGYLSRLEILQLMASVDSYVSLHRSEGYGLPFAECMLLEKPVIATGYSGNVDFMNHSNSLLVRHRLIEIDQPCGPYPLGARWADPDLEHAAELMRQVAADRDRSREIGRSARRELSRTLSFDTIGRTIHELFEKTNQKS